MRIVGKHWRMHKCRNQEGVGSLFPYRPRRRLANPARLGADAEKDSRPPCFPPRPPARRRLRGAVVLIVLAALVVASAVLVSIARLAVADRTAWRAETWRMQASWLAESGLDRAAARLQADADYRGEIWTVAAGDFDGRQGGRITIAVDSVADRPRQRRVRVEADYPDDPHDRARQTREAVLLTNLGESEP